MPCNTARELEDKLNAIPMSRREEEHYICPTEDGWEDRYYARLFRTDPTPRAVSTICKSYMESLEWNMKYYTMGCPDWNIHYKFDYPPLLIDLLEQIPEHNISFVDNNHRSLLLKYNYWRMYFLNHSYIFYPIQYIHN